MRGTLILWNLTVDVPGIIPACAGNTMVSALYQIFVRDHPRVCGEHSDVAIISGTLMGSSPRVRGTLGITNFPTFMAGIIPACAGNTNSIGLCRCPVGDHPRVCGEHGEYGEVWFAGTGSSPRVRGTPEVRCLRHVERGIIPACAGNTWSRSAPSSRRGDHPRVCGEHCDGRSRRSPHAGSSPRVRGTQGRFDRIGREDGIIPACAGNTL